jgi:hypothetical protein
MIQRISTESMLESVPESLILITPHDVIHPVGARIQLTKTFMNRNVVCSLSSLLCESI